MFKRSNRFIASESPKKNSFFSKITLGIAAATFSLGLTSASAEESLSTVYHIYLDAKYMGSVNDQNLISTVTKTKIETASETYKDLNLSVEDIEIIPEKMFRPVYDNNETVVNLNKELDVVVEATQLMINGEAVAHFNSSEEAESVLNKYKLLYLSEEELKSLELQKMAPVAVNSLQEGQSRLLDVTFTEEVSLEPQKVAPDKVLTAEQGLNLLKKGTLSEKKYKVKDHDVLGGIANQHNLSLEELLKLNPGLKEDSLIKPGEELNVTILTPFVKVSAKEESSKKEVIAFETEIKEDSSMPKGEKKTTQKGVNGERLVNYMIYKENGTEVKRETVSEQTLKEPVKEIIVKGTKVIPSRGTGDLSWPAVGGYVSSGLGQRWGKLHKGIDIARPSNKTIKAADNGKVVSAGFDGGYGNKVVIDHNNGMRTVYAHLESISVSVGQVVSQGQKLGVMGSTGNSTGVHLHFEVYENGNLKNPMDYL
ncbi:murein DD-endopeptidase MepM/ murein hydrolase activator NlpD [Metabacillus crassostreae]|uniref:M23 family metallopeptidase n=1 Tax=Metabacillus crassostreae TaxID=929098 RepID=UPI003083FCA6|nr:murein DD-endopeptidase MepM/ murein hydrolase activator NlpD [Metabacillus crassostreae]